MRLKNRSAEIDFSSQPNDFRFSTECFYHVPKGRFQSSNIPFASTPKSPQS